MSLASRASLTADVVIVGGGPAGAAAARLLAQWDRSVILIGRAGGKRIGESLPPSSSKLLDEIGVRGAVDAAEFVRATGNTVLWGSGERRSEPFARSGSRDARGYQIARDRFDDLLVDAAQAAGAHVVRGASVRSVVRDGDEWTVSYDSTQAGAAERVTCRAPWVLDCSGRAGVIARTGWRRPAHGERTTAVVGVFECDRWRHTEFATHTLVESYGGGWAWSVPVSLTRRYVTVMLDPRQRDVPTRGALLEAYRAELGRTLMLSELIDDAVLTERPWGMDASPYSAAQVGENGVLLVGDAASFIDPLSSFGVKKALASAWLAAIVVNSALTDATLAPPAIALFEEREQRMFRDLQQESVGLAHAAAAEHAGEFWSARADREDAAAPNELDAALVRGDPRVLRAFEELKRRDAIALRTSEALSIIERAVVRGNRVVLEDHLASPALPRGTRYCRNVDLLTVTRLAPRFDQVPDLFAAYNRAASPAPLPDFLGALSALIGLEMLAFA